MILIFGGAYQGKLEFARTLPDCGAGEVFDCRESSEGGREPADTPPALPDFTADIICGLQEFTWECCAEDPATRIEAADLMREHREAWRNKILIIDDVSQGIVPMDARVRAFREMNGRLMLYLASEAEAVYRVFCGIGKRIK